MRRRESSWNDAVEFSLRGLLGFREDDHGVNERMHDRKRLHSYKTASATAIPRTVSTPAKGRRELVHSNTVEGRTEIHNSSNVLHNFLVHRSSVGLVLEHICRDTGSRSAIRLHEIRFVTIAERTDHILNDPPER